MKKLFASLLLSAFALSASAQTAVLFPLAQMTGTTNDTTITIKPINNPVKFHSQIYWLPTAGITLKTINGSATTNLIPNDYNIAIAGVPGSWRISVNDTNVTLNAAEIGNLTTYTFTDLFSYVKKIIPGANISISPASGQGNVTINSTGSGSGGAATNVYQLQVSGSLLTLQTNLVTLVYTIAGVAQTNANMQLWGATTPNTYSNLFDLAGTGAAKAAAATNNLKPLVVGGVTAGSNISAIVSGSLANGTLSMRVDGISDAQFKDMLSANLGDYAFEDDFEAFTNSLAASAFGDASGLNSGMLPQGRLPAYVVTNNLASGLFTNSGVVFYVTNGTPQVSLPNGSLCLQTSGQMWLRTNNAWVTINISGTGSGGSGTVTSVGLSLPSIFTVSGTPITGSGTLAASLNVTLTTNNGTLSGVLKGDGGGGVVAATSGTDYDAPGSAASKVSIQGGVAAGLTVTNGLLGVASITRPDGTYTNYFGATDTARGAALSNALFFAQAKDVVRISSGTFSITGTNGQFIIPAGVTVQGSGDSTILTKASLPTNSVIKSIVFMNSNSTLRDFCISNSFTITPSNLDRAIDWDTAINHTGSFLKMRNLSVYADADSMESPPSGFKIFVENSRFVANYDGPNCGGDGNGGEFEFRHCIFSAIGGSGSAQHITRAIVFSDGGIAKVYDSVIIANPTGEASTEASAVASGDTGLGELHNCSIIYSNSISGSYGVHQGGAGIKLFNCNIRALGTHTNDYGEDSGDASHDLIFNTSGSGANGQVIYGNSNPSFLQTYVGNFSGDGSVLTFLNASQLSSGTVPHGRLPSFVLTNAWKVSLEIDGAQTNGSTLWVNGNQTNNSSMFVLGTVTSVGGIFSGGLSNATLTANTLVKSDANKKLSSIPNGVGVLTNDANGNFGYAALANASGLVNSQPVFTDGAGNLTNSYNFAGATNYIPWTHEGTTTNITVTFNGSLQSFTCTNGPSIGQDYFIHFAGANGSASFRFVGSSYNNLHFDYVPTWLAGSNSVITNGVLSLTSYGGTNAAQILVTLKEKQ